MYYSNWCCNSLPETGNKILLLHNELCQAKPKALVTRRYLRKEQGGLLVTLTMQKAGSRAEWPWANLLALVNPEPLWGCFGISSIFNSQAWEEYFGNDFRLFVWNQFYCGIFWEVLFFKLLPSLRGSRHLAGSTWGRDWIFPPLT